MLEKLKKIGIGIIDFVIIFLIAGVMITVFYFLSYGLGTEESSTEKQMSEKYFYNTTTTTFVTETETEPETIVETTTTTTAAVTTTRVITTTEKLDDPNLIDLGRFKITLYCSCQKCCGQWAIGRPVDEFGQEIVYGATGRELIPDYSVGVDPNVIPYGSILIINGKEYRADDTGDLIGKRIIDVYSGSNHQEAWNKAAAMSSQYANVYLVKE